FICNFIWEYFLKTCASPWRSICVTHSTATSPSTQPRGICGAKVVDAEVWNLCAPKSLQASDRRPERRDRYQSVRGHSGAFPTRNPCPAPDCHSPCEQESS